MTSPRYVYAKFLIDSESGKTHAFQVSTVKSRIDSWTGKQDDGAATPKKEDAKPTKPPQVFHQIVRAFLKENEAYEYVVPLLMNTLSRAIGKGTGEGLRTFCARRGEIQTGPAGFETYRLPLESLEDLVGRIDSFTAMTRGVSALPGMFVMGLVSSYDAFFSQILGAILATRPEIISQSEKQLSLKELMELESIEAARAKLVDKEIEDIMRSSHAEQIAWIENKLKIKVRENNTLWSDYIELFERRNALTHTSGCISTQYLAVCKQHGLEVEKLKVGDTLDISPKYLRGSIDLLAEFGIKLVGQVWRKLEPDDEQWLEALGDMGYDLIKKRRTDLASRVLKFALFEQKKLGSDKTRKRILINYANAEKLSGRKERALEIVAGEDWSASTDDFGICVAAIRDDVDAVVSLMKWVVSAELLKIDDFRQWPVFRTLHADERFLLGFEKAFDQPLLKDVDAKDGTKPENLEK